MLLQQVSRHLPFTRRGVLITPQMTTKRFVIGCKSQYFLLVCSPLKCFSFRLILDWTKVDKVTFAVRCRPSHHLITLRAHVVTFTLQSMYYLFQLPIKGGWLYVFLFVFVMYFKLFVLHLDKQGQEFVAWLHHLLKSHTLSPVV